MMISIRMPEELKREMDRLRDEVNWSEEIREFIKREGLRNIGRKKSSTSFSSISRPYPRLLKELRVSL